MFRPRPTDDRADPGSSAPSSGGRNRASFGRREDGDAARLAALAGALPEAVLVVDGAGRIVIANPAADRLLDDIVAFEPGPEAPVGVAVGSSLDLERLCRRTARSETFAESLVMVAEDGRRRWFEARARPVPGETDGGILVVVETTDARLRQLEEEFVGIVVHELRTPLTALVGYLQMLQRSARDGEERVLALAVEQADRLRAMVDELLDVTRVERGRLSLEPSPVHLAELIDETVAIVARATDGRRFRIEVGDSEAAELVVPIDRQRIQQALVNLLMNAIVYAPASPEIVVGLRSTEGAAEVRVEDEGPGISPEIRESLFIPSVRGGVRAGRAGLGLGLFITRQIVRAHGGTIQVDSAVGRGTSFTIRLPLAGVLEPEVTLEPAFEDERAADAGANGRPVEVVGAADETR
jgi:two-component system CheB/CheR fusion protein